MRAEALRHVIGRSEPDLNIPRTAHACSRRWRTGRALAGRGGATKVAGSSGAGTSIPTHSRYDPSGPYREPSRSSTCAPGCRRRRPGRTPRRVGARARLPAGGLRGPSRRCDRADQGVRPPPRADQAQLTSVVAALDAGRPVVLRRLVADGAGGDDRTAILGVDAMQVPPPDRKGATVDGHAVVIVGYGRHDASRRRLPHRPQRVGHERLGRRRRWVHAVHATCGPTPRSCARSDNGRWPGSWTGR